MGICGSKDKDKKEDKKSNKKEEKPKDEKKDTKKAEEKPKDSPVNNKEASEHAHDQAGSEAEQAEAEHADRAEDEEVAREMAPEDNQQEEHEHAPSNPADLEEEEMQERDNIVMDAYTEQEQLEREHIEHEADSTSPLQQQQQAEGTLGTTADGEPVVSRTVKKRPARQAGAPTTPRKPSTVSAPSTPVPVSATFRDAEGNVIEEAPTSTQPEEGTTLGVNGQLIELPKDDIQWKVMRPPVQDTSSWRLLRQVRVVFQLQNVTAI